MRAKARYITIVADDSDDRNSYFFFQSIDRVNSSSYVDKSRLVLFYRRVYSRPYRTATDRMKKKRRESPRSSTIDKSCSPLDHGLYGLEYEILQYTKLMHTRSQCEIGYVNDISYEPPERNMVCSRIAT